MKYLISLIVIALAACIGIFLVSTVSNPEDLIHVQTLADVPNVEQKSQDKAENIKGEAQDYLKFGYETEEYYLYKMHKLCATFQRHKIRTKNQLDYYLESTFPNENNETFDLAVTAELKANFAKCEEFLRQSKGTLTSTESGRLLDMAVKKNDQSAVAIMALDYVLSEYKTVAEVKSMLVPALAKNTPEALSALSLLSMEYSSLKNKTLVANALLHRACEAGLDNCGQNNIMVLELCRIESVCAGSLQESIQMSVRPDDVNEFESILSAVYRIESREQWEAYFEKIFGEIEAF